MKSKSITLLLLCCVVLLHSYGVRAQEKSFVFITASFNNKDWYEHNVSSIFAQNYCNWRLIYINDASTDGTGDLVRDFIATYSMQDRVTLINNVERKGHLYNQYHAIHTCKKDEIIVILDGDDFLAHENVLAYLNEVYANPDVWLTFGQFQYYPSGKIGMCKPIDEQCIKDNAFRKKSVALSHLRTFYAGLFHHIRKEDLFYEGNFFPMAADAAIMFPMIEMAGDRFRFISDVLLIYNTANMLNFSKDREKLQKMYLGCILARPCYTRITTYLSEELL